MPGTRRGAGVEAVLSSLKEHGLLLLTDPKLPSVAGLVAGEPVRGSWWGHPKGQEIFQVAEEIADREDVLLIKLVSGKATFVSHRLWPAVLAVGTAREPWQIAGLSAAARKLLARVDAEGAVRASGDGPRELERRLLVLGESVHTESGAHAKSLSSWSQWRERLPAKSRPRTIPAAQGKRELEAAVRSLNERFSASGRLPWSNVAR